MTNMFSNTLISQSHTKRVICRQRGLLRSKNVLKKTARKPKLSLKKIVLLSLVFGRIGRLCNLQLVGAHM